MGSSPSDAVDRGIIYRLRENARTTITGIVEYVDVSDDTVRNRIQHLEDEGVIHEGVIGGAAPTSTTTPPSSTTTGSFRTARVSEREELAGRALEVPGVIEVRTLMTGSRSTYVTAAGSDNDVTRIALALDGIGLGIDEESLVRRESRQPLERFRLENDE